MITHAQNLERVMSSNISYFDEIQSRLHSKPQPSCIYTRVEKHTNANCYENRKIVIEEVKKAPPIPQITRKDI
jgi:hypothetical protein